MDRCCTWPDAQYSPNPDACPYVWKEVEAEPDYKALYEEYKAKYDSLLKQVKSDNA